MLLFWYMLRVFGKLKQMGNHEGTFCLTGVPSVVPRTAAATASPGVSGASCRLFGAVVWLLCATAHSYPYCNGLVPYEKYYVYPHFTRLCSGVHNSQRNISE